MTSRVHLHLSLEAPWTLCFWRDLDNLHWGPVLGQLLGSEDIDIVDSIGSILEGTDNRHIPDSSYSNCTVNSPHWLPVVDLLLFEGLHQPLGDPLLLVVLVH